jgi:hypothetical protein
VTHNFTQQIKTAMLRSSFIQDFSKVHHEEMLLGWRIKRGLAKGIEADRIARFCKHFYKHNLSGHMEKEEKNIFSKLNPNDPVAQKLLQEHQQVRKIIEGLGQDSVNTIDFLIILADELDSHIRTEENVFLDKLEHSFKKQLVESSSDESLIEEESEWDDCFW